TCCCVGHCCCFFFFFSSRRRHTRCYRDWSSDVCSSDLGGHDDRQGIAAHRRAHRARRLRLADARADLRVAARAAARNGEQRAPRSEERRVGKEGRTVRSTEAYKRATTVSITISTRAE